MLQAVLRRDVDLPWFHGHCLSNLDSLLSEMTSLQSLNAVSTWRGYIEQNGT